jgi:hypothetical protein
MSNNDSGEGIQAAIEAAQARAAANQLRLKLRQKLLTASPRPPKRQR